MTLRLDDLHKRFGEIPAVDGVSLTLPDSGTLALLGPSGCGKSTLLRLVAGLEQPDRGAVILDDRKITGLPAQERGMGVVFQDYALFPHLDVAGNVGFALRELQRDRRPSGAEIGARVADLLELVGLQGLERRRTFELSGGQQQRVALARALAAQPSVLLLDEPLSNLDPELRGVLQLELRDLLSRIGTRAIYVTHDRAEALAVAPLLAVMRAGRLEQVGPGQAVLASPRNAWVASFLGYRNLFPAARLPAGGRSEGHILIRDDLVRIGGHLPTRVDGVERTGHRLRLTLDVPSWGESLVWEGYRRELPHDPAVGDELGIDIPEAAWVRLDDG
jgi:ABC-type Fe3+/spermidine/putrescine transport system ATPase subunit